MAGKLDSAGSFAVTSESGAQHVVDAVKQWFSAPGNTNWVLVFDNLDDLDLVDIEECLPSCNHGTVIIISRRRESIQQGRRVFEVQQMNPTEAVQLLLSACAIPTLEDLVTIGKCCVTRKLLLMISALADNRLIEQAAASMIAQELGYLPLALSQAGAYIHMSHHSLSQYLEEYPNNVSYLLSKKWKGGQHDRSVFATWEISFKAISEKISVGSGATVGLWVFLTTRTFGKSFYGVAYRWRKMVCAF